MTPAALALACLSLNVYYEAGNEPAVGQYAVALVTINRTLERDLDVCGVVFEKRQFSWANSATDKNGMLLPEYMPNINTDGWHRARRVAKNVLSGVVYDFTGGATYFHAPYVRPPWVSKKTFVGQWGTHYFYADKRKL